MKKLKALLSKSSVVVDSGVCVLILKLKIFSVSVSSVFSVSPLSSLSTLSPQRGKLAQTHEGFSESLARHVNELNLKRTEGEE